MCVVELRVVPRPKISSRLEWQSISSAPVVLGPARPCRRNAVLTAARRIYCRNASSFFLRTAQRRVAVGDEWSQG